MDVTTLVILIGVAVAALGILVLKLGKRLAIFLLALGGCAAVVAVAFALAEQARATRQAAQAATVAAAGQAVTSAATSITLFLLMIILALVLAAVGAVVGWRWLQGYQERDKMRKVLQQAQLYALLNGARLPSGRATRPATPQQAGGNVFVFPGGQQTTPQLTLDDLRGMTAGQPDPLAGLLPPDDWEVM